VNHKQYVSDPSIVLNLNTNEWGDNTLQHLNITINNYGNTIGAGGAGGPGGATSSLFATDIWHAGGGGGSGQGLHQIDSIDSYSTSDVGSYNTIELMRAGLFGQGTPSLGANGTQGTQTSAGTGGLKGGSQGQGYTQISAMAGGSAVYLQSNVTSILSGTSVDIINKSTGMMFGGGGGGGGGYSGNGGDGGDMFTGGIDNRGSNGAISTLTLGIWPESTLLNKAGGWQGNILWWHSSNLQSSFTITNENTNQTIAGRDGTW
jgi:hypothetical protein